MVKKVELHQKTGGLTVQCRSDFTPAANAASSHLMLIDVQFVFVRQRRHSEIERSDMQ